MPIYEYECSDCGKRFDRIISISDAEKSQSLDCNNSDCSGSAARVMSAPAFHLKGSGWYQTDYAGGKAGATAGASAASSDSTAASSPKTESSSPSASSSDTSSKPAASASSDNCGN